MLSKDLFDEFMRPYYDQVVPALQRHGILPAVDSDGNMTMATGWFKEAGVEGILPLERQAGNDINQLQSEHPEMKFIGHFDKMTMPHGEMRMREEFERLLPAASKGRYMISCDHQTPPGVSLENYRTYLSLFREYAEEAGRRSRESAI